MENNKVEFDYVKRKDGTSYFKEFMDSLPVKDKAKMLSTITKTQEHGLLVAQKMEWVKKLDNDIYELRSKVGSNIQRKHKKLRKRKLSDQSLLEINIRMVNYYEWN